MKSTQNKMNNSSCCTNADEMARDDLREIRNQGDVRNVTENGGNRDRINMTRS